MTGSDDDVRDRHVLDPFRERIPLIGPSDVALHSTERQMALQLPPLGFGVGYCPQVGMCGNTVADYDLPYYDAPDCYMASAGFGTPAASRCGIYSTSAPWNSIQNGQAAEEWLDGGDLIRQNVTFDA